MTGWMNLFKHHKIIFNSYGHKNVTGTHKNTFEFTKDKTLNINGDCIIGINSDFKDIKVPCCKPKSLGFGFDASDYPKLKIIIKCGKLTDTVEGFYNPDYCDRQSIVFRKSNYRCKRTFAFYCNKAAIDIDRNIISMLKDPKTKAEIEIELIPINDKTASG